MSSADPPAIVALRVRRRGRRIGSAIRWLPSVDSTNDAARAWLDDDGPDGLAVLAGGQIAGRGRRGRAWISPPGRGLYLSVGLRVDLPGSSAARLMMLGAVATAEALRAAGLSSEIRWPNDVDVGGRKIAGVLAESRIDRDRIRSAVLGIGINLRHQTADFPPEVAGRATSVLLERGAAPPEITLAEVLLERIELWSARLDDAGAADDSLAERWKSLAPGHHGARVTVEGEGETFVGVTCGLDPDGALLVRTPAGAVRAVRVGELRRLHPGVDGPGAEGAEPPEEEGAGDRSCCS